MIFNQMLSRTIKTPNLTKTELSSIFFSLCTVAFLLCKQTNFRFCGKVDREASCRILPRADPCLSPKRDLTLSLTFSLTHSLAHLPATRSSRHTLVSHTKRIMDGDLYYPMSRKKLGHAVIINNLDREQIPTQRLESLKKNVDFVKNILRDVSIMATVLQEIGK